MRPAGSLKTHSLADTAPLLPWAAALVILHIATNGEYGFHRDELSTLEDARSLAWGYVGVPPFIPFLARGAFALFGPSLTGLRFFSSLAMGIAFVLTGLIARELGGSRRAQIVAALAAAISSVALSAGALYQYVSFDYLWWVAAAYCAVRLLSTDDARWCLGVGAAIGIGLLTKYTIAFLAAGIAAGLLFTPARRYFRSAWLWLGVALVGVIALPHLIWQFQHDFITLDFLQSIHARDVRMGRGNGFLLGQFWITTSPFTVPLWLAGLYYLFAVGEGKRFRVLGWMFVVPLVLFVVAKGRDYYMAPAYPMLLAAGAVWAEQRMASLHMRHAAAIRWSVCVVLAIGAVLGAAPVLPIAPVGSTWWRFADRVNGGNFNEELGWPDMAENVARIRDTLPEGQRASVGILVADTGQAGAIDLFGARLKLPSPISGTNSHWFRGYGDPPPKPLIVVGFPSDIVQRELASCRMAERLTNRFGIANSTVSGRDIFVCEAPRQPWPQFWRGIQVYG
ncbi:glycosyltransferase family 39 protein [Caballeronia sp. LP006]|uniref:glycosyltransferase family 39 protein n=1 Tax=Caballeronia sp. LP006 TaxID=3038552 RepID=UPI002856F8F6|nr:glycosyltransferase family 39 protein [Caballeronia sp. LP006]MDR5826625.1 glycosyltransferase family 39 protein [Caballeronia sp. LP006]